MRSARTLTLVGAALLLEGRTAVASERPVTTSHVPYWTSGVTYYGGDRRVMAGFGGGPGYRLELGERFAAHVEARWLVFVGQAFVGAAGVTHRWRRGSWEPTLGLQVAAHAGDGIRIVTREEPSVAAPVAWALQARGSLLRFVGERFTASALGVDAGLGLEAGTLAFALSVLEIGIRL